LIHATIGIPNGHGLLSPLIATITAQPKTRQYKDQKICINATTQQSLANWKTLLPIALQDPTLCTDLVPALVDFGGYCDASKEGAGEVWFGLNKALPPLVWQVLFPLEIQNDIVSEANPTRKISNSNLEMTGLLLHWLVLERIADLAHLHVACWCNNTPTVANLKVDHHTFFE